MACLRPTDPPPPPAAICIEDVDSLLLWGVGVSYERGNPVHGGSASLQLEKCMCDVDFISEKVFYKSFCQIHPPHKLVKLFFTLTSKIYELTNLCGS